MGLQTVARECRPQSARARNVLIIEMLFAKLYHKVSLDRDNSIWFSFLGGLCGGGLSSRSLGGGSFGRSGFSCGSLNGGLSRSFFNNRSGVILLVGGLLLLEVLGEELFVSHRGLSGSFPSGHLARLVESLSSESLLGNKSLDLGGFVESLVTKLDLSADNILSNIILLSEGEGLSNFANSLGTKSSRSLRVGESGNISVTLLKNLKGNDTEIGSADAASDGLSLPLTSSSRSVGLGPRSEKDSNTAVDHDTLFHGESLLVVTAGDSEGVSLEFLAKDDSVDIRAHSSVVEVAIDLIIINFFYDLLPGHWVSDVVFHCVSGIMIGSTAG